MPNSKIENVDIGDLESIWTSKKVIDKNTNWEKVNAKFKGKSFSEPYVIVLLWGISYTRNLFYLHYWEIILLLSWGFSIGYSYLLIGCKF